MTQGEIEQIPIPFQRHMADLEMRIMSDLINRLKANAEITSTADWQINRLQQLGIASSHIKKQIKQALELSQKDIDWLFDDAIKKEYIRNKDIYDKCGETCTPFNKNKELQELVTAVKKQTEEEIRNITKTLGFAVKAPNGKIVQSPVREFYQSTLDNAVMDMATGSFSYDRVLKLTVAAMTNSGLRSIAYESGWSNRVEVAARRAVMTGFNQVQAKINEQVARDLKTDFFEVSWHSGARPEHQLWQGGVYSYKDLVGICGLGTVTGLLGANCYHQYNAFISGVSVRTYTDEQLKQMNAAENVPVEYKGKEYTRYEALQQQRKLETLMRKQRQDAKLLQEGGGSRDDIIAAKSRYNSTMAQYSDFSKKMNLPQQKERIYQDGLGNPFARQAGQKTIEKMGQSGKISLSKDEMRIRKHDKETAILYSHAGDKLWEKKGEKHSVSFTRHETEQMKGNILTHNHPGGATFSNEDIHLLHVAELREIRAVGRDYIYAMEQPQNWNEAINSQPKLKKEYEEIQKALYEEMVRDAWEKSQNGSYTAADYTIEYQEKIIEKLTQKYAIPYRKEKPE